MPKTTTKTPTPPLLVRGYNQNYKTMILAAQNDDLGIVSAIRKSDGKAVCLVVAKEQHKDGSYVSVPFAELIRGNPFELYHDPTL